MEIAKILSLEKFSLITVKWGSSCFGNSNRERWWTTTLSVPFLSFISTSIFYSKRTQQMSLGLASFLVIKCLMTTWSIYIITLLPIRYIQNLSKENTIAINFFQLWHNWVRHHWGFNWHSISCEMSCPFTTPTLPQ